MSGVLTAKMCDEMMPWGESRAHRTAPRAAGTRCICARRATTSQMLTAIDESFIDNTLIIRKTCAPASAGSNQKQQEATRSNAGKRERSGSQRRNRGQEGGRRRRVIKKNGATYSAYRRHILLRTRDNRWTIRQEPVF